MLAQNLMIIPHNSPGRTPFAELWLLAMLDDNPASRASAMGCFTHMRFTHRVVAKRAGILFNRSLSHRSATEAGA